MNNILWKSTNPDKSQMVHFMHQINKSYDLNMTTYNEFYNWSINHINLFWKEFWGY